MTYSNAPAHPVRRTLAAVTRTTALAAALDTVTARECSNYFAHAGYELI